VSGQAEFRERVSESREALHGLFGTGAQQAATDIDLPELLELPVTGPGFYAMSAEAYHQDPCPSRRCRHRSRSSSLRPRRRMPG
jgi:hypothetical protein